MIKCGGLLGHTEGMYYIFCLLFFCVRSSPRLCHLKLHYFFLSSWSGTGERMLWRVAVEDGHGIAHLRAGTRETTLHTGHSLLANCTAWFTTFSEYVVLSSSVLDLLAVRFIQLRVIKHQVAEDRCCLDTHSREASYMMEHDDLQYPCYHASRLTWNLLLQCSCA